MPSPADTHRIAIADLAKQLASSLGLEKATEEVLLAAKTLGIGPDALDREATLRVLEAMAERHGLVGTVARFAKVRVILQFDSLATSS